ncbi:MAG: hypothetical protein QME41_04775 [Actinomycetota bacterium]|nr:hypothetical protein [Actinomycetota bacterium]
MSLKRTSRAVLPPKHASVFVDAWEMAESSTRSFLFIDHVKIFVGRTEFDKDKEQLGGYDVASTLDFSEALTVGLKKGETDAGSVMVGKNDNDTSIVITLTAE